jgi:hypothetical protein
MIGGGHGYRPRLPAIMGRGRPRRRGGRGSQTVCIGQSWAGTPENDLRPGNGRTRVGYRYTHMCYDSNYEMLIHEYWCPKIPLASGLGKIASSLLSSPEIVPLNSAADPRLI